MCWPGSGLDEVRLPLPVRFGDTIHADVVVRESRRPTSKPGRGVIVLDYAVLQPARRDRDDVPSTFLLKMAATRTMAVESLSVTDR